METLFDHLLSAAFRRPYGTVTPNILAVLRLITKVELGGLYNWQVARLLPFENPADIDADQAIYVRQAVAVCHQTATASEFG